MYREYKVLKIFGTTGMNVKMSEKQVQFRSHNLKDLPGEPGVYNCVGPTEFKVGELIGLKNVPKSVRHCLEPTDGKGWPKRNPTPMGKAPTSAPNVDPELYQCEQCNHDPYKTAKGLADHMMNKHGV